MTEREKLFKLMVNTLHHHLSVDVLKQFHEFLDTDVDHEFFKILTKKLQLEKQWTGT